MIMKSAIRHWRIKGIIQGGLSLLPGGAWINDHLQTTVGDLKRFESNVGLKMDDWTGIMSYLEAIGRNQVAGQSIFEIGSGWYPTLPLSFALAGAERIYTADLNCLMNEPLTFRMLNALEAHLDRIAAKSAQPIESVREKYRRLKQAQGLKQLLEVANVDYRAPQDAAKLTWMPAGTLDMVYSNSVLEHVSPEVIPCLMREAWRVLRPVGLMVHAVACNDHYAHFDKSISFVNYLQYTDKQWRVWNNRLNYQNRLRAPEFIRFAEESGFQIMKENRAYRPGSRQALAHIRIAPEFAAYSTEDLAATTVDFIAAKPKR
jgi:SAM-dependent methyltransferase